MASPRVSALPAMISMSTVSRPARAAGAAGETDLGVVLDLALEGGEHLPLRPVRLGRPARAGKLVFERVGLAHALAEPLVGRVIAEAIQGPANGLGAGARDARHDQRVPRFQVG